MRNKVFSMSSKENTKEERIGVFPYIGRKGLSSSVNSIISKRILKKEGEFGVLSDAFVCHYLQG